MLEKSHSLKPVPRILIVEDEQIVAMDISISLEGMGYKVVGNTVSGAETLVMAEQMRPDLVLVDVYLQGAMDGIELARLLRDELHLPVVFLTAYSEDDLIQRVKEVEPFGYILKPFENRELRIVIEMALYKHQIESALRQKYAEIDRFNKVTMGRELRMIELKQEINDLLRASGQAEKYRIVNDG